MKIRFARVFAWGFLALPLALIGCGGGGGGGGPKTPTTPTTPTTTSTPTIPTTPTTPTTPGTPGTPAPPVTCSTGTTVVVQLRDSLGNVVNGIVAIGTQMRATTNGDATLCGIRQGGVTVSAEVNGAVTTQSATVVAGTTTVTFTINPNVTITPSATIPGTPF